MDDYTLSMADAINEHQGNADADHSVNVSMAEAINEYQDRFSADTEGVTEHQATIPADTNHSPGAKIVFASADAIATPSHRAADANICPTLSHVPQVGQMGQVGQVGQGWCALISQISHGWEKWEMASRQKARKKRGSHLAAPELVFCLVVWLECRFIS